MTPSEDEDTTINTEKPEKMATVWWHPPRMRTLQFTQRNPNKHGGNQMWSTENGDSTINTTKPEHT